MMEEMDDNEVVQSIRPTSDFTNITDNPDYVPTTVVKAPSPSPSTYVKKAILSKKGMGKLIRPWVLRTIVLDRNNKLLYYDGKQLKGELLLEGATARHIDSDMADGRPFAFEVSGLGGTKKHQNSSLILAASCINDANDWVEALTKAANALPVQKSHDVTGYTTFEEAASQSKPLDLKKLKENRQKALEEKRREEVCF
jgi:hypothetical protein